jgi:hypothetical protein
MYPHLRTARWTSGDENGIEALFRRLEAPKRIAASLVDIRASVPGFIKTSS